MDRRDFLKHLGALGLGAVAARAGFSAEGKTMNRLPRRRYGDTGLELSIIGLGGIVVSRVPQTEANDTVAWAVERGCNYFDVAPTYGNAQDRLGPALKPYRDSAFLACKTVKRDAAGSREELEDSLRVLQTDYFDLYQLHGMTKMEEVEQVFGPGGAMETFLRAREEGKARWIGFSAHNEDVAIALLERFKFDSLLFPLNAVCMENANFGRRLIGVARQRGTARLGLKAIAWTTWPAEGERKYPKCWYQPADDPELADRLLRYVLDLPVTATVPPGDVRLFKLLVELAMRYEPLDAPERGQLLATLQGVKPIFGQMA
jgi:hypothetical protein